MLMHFCIKKLLIISLVAIPLTPAFSESAKPSKSSTKKADPQDALKLANIDKVTSYGGIEFGAPLPESGFILEQDRGSLKTYKKSGEQLLLGPALLDSVVYYFFNGKFYGVAFHTNAAHTNDIEDALALKNIFIDAFGNGEDSAGGEPSTIWIGKKHGLIYDLNPSTGDASAFLFDKNLHDAVLTDQSAGEQAAAQQLIK